VLTEAEVRTLSYCYAVRLDEQDEETRWVCTDCCGTDLPELVRLMERGWLERRRGEAQFRLTDEGLAAIQLGAGINDYAGSVN
jgi:hypothetical protein